jgi:hypothetical protein
MSDNYAKATEARSLSEAIGRTPFPDWDEACDRMVVAVRSLTSFGQRDSARYLLDLFVAAMDDGDEPKMRTELGKAEALAAKVAW